MLAAAAAVLASCGDSAKSASAPTTKKAAEAPKKTPAAQQKRQPSDTELLTTLLADRGAALEQGDVEDFLATSTGGQLAKDKRQMTAAKALPLTSVKLEARGTEITKDKATMRVDMSYSFDGIDTYYFKTSSMTLRKTPEGWRVASDRPTYGLLAPWEYKRYTARKSTHFLALAPRGMKVGSLMTDLEKGYNRMKRGLPGVKAPKKVLVIVARSGTDTKALTKDIKTLRSLTAVAENQYSANGPAKKIERVWGQRVFVLWRSYGNRGADTRRKVIAHELVHTALASRTSARTPPWLTEGIAMYVSGDNRSGDAGALISGRGVLKDQSKQGAATKAMSLVRLSKPNALTNMSPVSLSFAYSYSSAAAFAIAEKHGRKGLLRLLSAYNSEKLKGRGSKLTDRAVRRALHTSLSSLKRDVDNYASSHSRF
jgi:hypothetical protein